MNKIVNFSDSPRIKKLCMKLENLHFRLNKPLKPLTKEAMLGLSTDLQILYKDLILFNPDKFIAGDLCTALWNDCFKIPLTRFKTTDKKLFHSVIEYGVDFYLSLIPEIVVRANVPFIKVVPSGTKSICSPNTRFLEPPTVNSVYFFIHSCLLRVGDLFRYRGSSYHDAIKMYEKSSAVCPSIGHPYHQMGLAQLQKATPMSEDVMGDYLSSLYFFARSLSTPDRYFPAYESIENLVKTKVKLMKTNALSMSEEVMQRFMLSIYDNSVASTLFPLMSQLVSTTTIHLDAPTLIKMIVISFWNNWRHQFSPNSLEIIAGIFNSVVQAITSASGACPAHSEYCLPHLKLLMEWMNWHQDDIAMLSFFNRLNVGDLTNVLNKLLADNAEIAPRSWAFEAILPEERKLIGFMPLDYSVCFNAGAIQFNGRPFLGGVPLSDDAEPKLLLNVRVHRIILVARKLASNRKCFHFNGSRFVDNQAFSTSNRTSEQDNQVDNQQHSELLSPSSSGSSFLTGSGSSNIYSPLGSADATTPPVSTSGLATTHDVFRSIWSPNV